MKIDKELQTELFWVPDPFEPEGFNMTDHSLTTPIVRKLQRLSKLKQPLIELDFLFKHTSEQSLSILSFASALDKTGEIEIKP